MIGIFWFVLDHSGERCLLAEGCELAAAETYGDCLTYGPGHYEIWERWRRSGPPDRPVLAAVRDHEYEEWPRGRIIFDRVADRYYLYADRRIRAAGLIGRVIQRFRLPEERVTIRSDFHYRSALALGRTGKAAP